jgi:hypothetical protein
VPVIRGPSAPKYPATLSQLKQIPVRILTLKMQLWRDNPQRQAQWLDRQYQLARGHEWRLLELLEIRRKLIDVGQQFTPDVHAPSIASARPLRGFGARA